MVALESMRVLGNMIQKLTEEDGVSTQELGKIINCTDAQVRQLFKGRLFLSYDQLTAVAKRLRVSTDVLLGGDIDHYRATFVDCVGEFSYDENREIVLDIIDDYLDLRTAIG